MKLWKKIATVAGTLLLLSAGARGQDSAAPKVDELAPLKITLILHEFDGKQEIASLPYELAVTAHLGANRNEKSRGSGRVGTRIPVMLTEKGSISYVDVGTSYDYWVAATGDGRFRVEATLDRSSVAATNIENIKPKNIPVEGPENPRINSLRLTFEVLLHDGESQEASTATDPLTGHIWKVEIRLKVLK
jgi:hypothetical protein